LAVAERAVADTSPLVAIVRKRESAHKNSAGAHLADAALMCIAEREGIDTVFTLDRRDFTNLPYHYRQGPAHRAGGLSRVSFT
jgi:predicted nucleic acid-binding protein